VIKLPIGTDINNIIDDLRSFSWEASDILMHFSNLIKTNKNHKNIVQFKDKNNPVTLADLRVNEKIIQRINQNYSRFGWEILSEENLNLEADHLNKYSDWLWVIDPLDGTKDFIQGTGNYAMHLALNYRNRPFLGVVLIPSKNELWFSDGEKAWCEKRNGYKEEKKLTKNKSLNEMTLVTSKNHRNQFLNILINKIQFKKKIVMGSIGCKIASIIRGESDIYISVCLGEESFPKDWDFAAPETILKAAGGRITNLENEELVYNKTNFNQSGIIIATNNKSTHKDICIQIKQIIKKNNLFDLD
tara:strand:- start:969 stop:1874 length:906 start_codon:yes stop_codon:yes gene_type:complete